MSIFVDGNEVKTHARDLKVLLLLTLIFLLLPHPSRRSQIFDKIQI